ncbi:MAG: MBL fold metallo-hydrolase [Planctomycetota bacterium]|nr:MBL fold metallo-hydrolase [Planctomycetota bacterium]
MSVEITWLGHASFRIVAGGRVIYIDPWKVSRVPHDADVVFVSHTHYDHCSSPDIAKVSHEGTVLIGPADTLAKLRGGHPLARGEGMRLGEMTFEGVAAYNIEHSAHAKTNGWLGVVMGLAGKRIYYSGDTDVVVEMAKLGAVDLAMLPVAGAYTMTPAQAAEACRQIGCQAALPYHWGDIVGARSDAQAFADAAPCPVHILNPGQTLTL